MFLIVSNGCSARKTNSDPRNAPVPSASAVQNSKTRELYEKNCVVCHQGDGEGGTVKLEDQKLKVPSLKSDRARRHSDESMIDQILKGGDGMPAFKEKLSRDAINDLVHFIREELQGNARGIQGEK
jgi:mono/diheme cytochrome c family protein